MLRPYRLQSFHLLRQNIHSSIILGEFAFHQYERLAAHGRATAIVDIGPHDDVRHSRFVFDQQEDDSFGGLRPLTGNDEACHLTFYAGPQLLEIAIERQVRR